MDDFWKFNVTSATWVLIDGGTDAGATVNFDSNSPDYGPSKRFCSASWSINNTFWMYGGFEYSDVWRYELNGAKKWVWESGSSIKLPNATYGTKGVASNSSLPRYRNFSFARVLQGNRVAMFGGGFQGGNSR